jgi:hypothetical protein
MHTQLQTEVYERLDEFKQIFAEITKEEVNPDELANAVITVGLDLMMVDFFRRLGDDTLRKSVEQFYAAYPGLETVTPIEHCDNRLVNIHSELSRRYPKQFFAFMFKTMKAEQYAKARERFHQLFGD